MTADVVGAARPRPDSPAKVRGATRYAADRPMRGLLHARLVLAQRAHARIVSIDTGAALEVPGVVAVLTAADLPLKGEGSDRLNRPLPLVEAAAAAMGKYANHCGCSTPRWRVPAGSWGSSANSSASRSASEPSKNVERENRTACSGAQCAAPNAPVM